MMKIPKLDGNQLSKERKYWEEEGNGNKARKTRENGRIRDAQRPTITFLYRREGREGTLSNT